jgi:hypothetical protein
MNRLALLVLAVSLPVAGLRAADAKTAAPSAPAAKQQKLLKVSTLNTAEANREFQANVQLIQAQREAAIQINAAMEKETNAAKKKELKGQLDALIAKLNENNEKMRKAYGFSLERNYTLEVEKAHVYMLVTDEEAAKIEATQKAAAAKK